MGQKKNKVHKKKPAVVEKTKNVDINRWLVLAVFFALAVLIFYPPYVRGLFFNEDIFIYHILTAIVFVFIWIEKIRKKDYSFLRTPLDWAVLAYGAAYLLSLFGAVHPGEGLYGFLRALNLFMVYWMVTRVVKDYQGYEKILQVLLASGAGVAAIGILAQPVILSIRLLLMVRRFIPPSTPLYRGLFWRNNLNRPNPLDSRKIYSETGLRYSLFPDAVNRAGGTVQGCLVNTVGRNYFISNRYARNISFPGSLFGVAAGAAALTRISIYSGCNRRRPLRWIAVLWIGLVIVIVGQALWETLAYSWRKTAP